MAKRSILILFFITRSVMAASEMGRVTEVVSPASVRMHFASGDRLVRLAGLPVPEDEATRRLLQIRLQTLTAGRWLLVEQEGEEGRLFRTPDGIEINAVLRGATAESLSWQNAHPDVTYLGELDLPRQTHSSRVRSPKVVGRAPAAPRRPPSRTRTVGRRR